MSTARGADDRCVLVVDDEEEIRDALCEAVEIVGCRAITAANGADALELIEKHRPCLVILDLLMPVMTGHEVIQAMRERSDLADVPILVSTSAPSRAPAGVPVLPKPIDIDKLFDWVRRSCRCKTARSST